MGEEGHIAQWLANLFQTQLPRVRFPELVIFSDGKIIDVVEVNHWGLLKESGKYHENVDQTHLELVSGKPVLQKSHCGQ